ncbi:cadherin-23, partial [Plakobranchus ocellatus]
MGWEALPLVLFTAVLLALSKGQIDNNAPPSWDESTIDPFVAGFSESTKVGTSIGQLRCIDPEDDPIRYALTSGTAVRVLSNGTVSLAVPLDFEKTDTIAYDLTFTCVDISRQTGRALHAPVETRTVISPNDANDNAPRFSVSSLDGYSFFISEASTVGTALTPTVLIRDIDRGENAILDKLYIVCNSPNATERINLTASSRATCEKFDISFQQTGEGRYSAPLRIISPLDYESRRTYSSNLIAIDGDVGVSPKLTTTVNIQINVQDAQDRNPIFTNVGASASVNEKATIVTELDKVTREETTATATATYSVFITDSNDNPPIFSESIYNVSVTEVQSNAPVQISGFRIDCNDPDEPTNARYTVRVIDQSFPTYSITPSLEFTGSASMFLQVEDSRFLDYDNPLYRNQRVVLEARETGTNELLSSTATILISLRDINDNPPIFGQSSYTVQISESQSQFPYNFLNISATDRDSGNNGRVRYRLEGGTENLFEVDEDTGRVFLLSAVNYESTPQYVFLAFAYDSAETSRQTQVQVTVDILNANDERPRFLLPFYQTSVNESSLQFFNPVNITAVDAEDGTTAITYRIVSGQSPNNAFVINRQTGVLTLQAFLNYEETPVDSDGKYTGVFELVVEASDNGQPPQTNTVPVIITVIDINDHSPIMNPTQYTVRLSELALPGTFVTQISATDADSGDFGTIFFRIGQGLSDNFFVNASTGLITVGRNRIFDYDVQNNYELQVIASDGGAPQRSATATVFIEILDGNNQSPEFAELLYYVYVDEKEPLNTVIQTIIAVDKDSTALLQYSIIESSIQASDPDGKRLSAVSAYDYKNAFGVNNQGQIFVKNQLRREAANEFTFTLAAVDINTDEGNPSGTTQVTVLITGEANTNITFDDATTVYMNENALVGYSAITVTARDPNNNAVQAYEMIKFPGSSDNFEVRPVGRIVLIRPVDYENDPQIDHLHRIAVRAYSNDRSQSATVTATISIVDVNDNSPQFQKTVYEAEVPETFMYPMEVATIFATDEDSRSYGPLEFRISGGLDSDDFIIFSEAPHGGSRTSRRATVLVSPGTTLDFNRRSEYNLDISVTDNVNTDFSSARLTTSAKLIIKVIDENNNSPIFVESFRTLAVPETAQVGQSIATLIAIDKDVGRNGDITYALEAVNEPDSVAGLELFSITPITGTVRVQGDLLGKGGKVYPVRVRARDQGDRPNSGYMQININVQNTEDDDGNPKWIRPSDGFVVEAPEEEPGYVLKDSDGKTQFFSVTPRTGTGIQYSLSTVGDDVKNFIINATTGEITITKSLDREKQERYSLLVYAEDTSNPDIIRTGRKIIVQLTDKDDNQPTFTNPKNYRQCEAIDRPLRLLVRENTPVDSLVYVLSACDPDKAEFSRIYYELDSRNDYCRRGNVDSILSLNSTTGGLTTNANVDYEQRNDYIMCVRALSLSPISAGRKKRSFDTDQVDMQLDNVAYINVVIVDENDNGPRFPESELVAVVQTRPPTGPVITLAATDPDGATNNVILYRVTSSVFIFQSGAEQASADVFTLRGASGALYPALPSYQSFSGGRFVLTVQAIDAGNPAFTDTVQVTIYVHDEGQAVKLILSDRPSDAVSYSSNMISELDAVDRRYSFTFLQLSEHRTQDGIEADKTDVCFLAVDEQDKTILNIRQVISVLDEQGYRDVLSQTQYNDVDRG